MKTHLCARNNLIEESHNSVALRDLIPFVQFKKHKKHPRRSVILLHGCFSRFRIVQIVPNCATHHFLIPVDVHLHLACRRFFFRRNLMKVSLGEKQLIFLVDFLRSHISR